MRVPCEVVQREVSRLCLSYSLPSSLGPITATSSGSGVETLVSEKGSLFPGVKSLLSQACIRGQKGSRFGVFTNGFSYVPGMLKDARKEAQAWSIHDRSPIRVKRSALSQHYTRADWDA